MSDSKNVCKELQLKIILNPPTYVALAYVARTPDSSSGEVQKCTCAKCLSGSNNWMMWIKFSGSMDYRKYMVNRDLANELRIKYGIDVND